MWFSMVTAYNTYIQTGYYQIQYCILILKIHVGASGELASF